MARIESRLETVRKNKEWKYRGYILKTNPEGRFVFLMDPMSAKVLDKERIDDQNEVDTYNAAFDLAQRIDEEIKNKKLNKLD